MLRSAWTILLWLVLVHPTFGQSDSARTIEVRPGISIQEFSIAYPDIAPRRTTFSGHLKVDSVWQGHRWNMDFTFGGDALSGAYWVSEPITPDSIPGIFARANREFQGYFGNTYLDRLPADSTWIQPHIWRLRNTQVVLQQRSDSLLELVLSSLTRSVEGFYAIDVPMLYGMPLGTFGVFHPHVVAKGIGYRGLVEQAGVVGSFRGKWQYWFENDTLRSMEFKSIFQARIAQDSSRYEMVSTYLQALMEAQSQRYGKPAFVQQPNETKTVLRDSKLLQSASWRIKEAGFPPTHLDVELVEYGPSDGFGYFMQIRYSLAGPPPND